MTTKPKSQLVAFRFPKELIEQLDAYAKQLETETPGLIVSRSEAARILLSRAFEEAKHTGRK